MLKSKITFRTPHCYNDLELKQPTPTHSFLTSHKAKFKFKFFIPKKKVIKTTEPIFNEREAKKKFSVTSKLGFGWVGNTFS